MPDLDDIFKDVAKALLPKKQRKELRRKLKKRGFWALLLMFLQRVLRAFSGGGTPVQSDSRSQPAPLRGAPPVVAPPEGAQTTVSPRAQLSPDVQRHMEQAAMYVRALNEMAHNASGTFDRPRLQNLADHVALWQDTLEELALRVDAFKRNAIVQADLKRVPQAIEELEVRQAQEENALVRAELTRTLDNRRKQWAALDKLHSTMRWGEVKLENTVAMLGTIYSQALISQSKGKVADYQRLLDQVDEEVHVLQDYLVALEAIKMGDGRLT
jgi:hypothetical protein